MAPRSTTAKTKQPAPGAILWLAPSLLDEDPGQPRQAFDDEALAQLTESVTDQGVTIPLEVIPQPDGRYRIVFGARRMRAALAANVATVPCLVSTASRALDIRRRQLLENSQRADLTPLEQAQSLYTIWLLAQIAACETEQGDDGAATSALLAAHPTPTAQIAALDGRLCTVANVESVVAYLGSGTGVRVPWQRVLDSAGMGQLTDGARKKLLAVLKLPPAVQNALAGTDVSARTLRDLARQSEADALALIDQAGDAGDVGAALRAALDAPHGSQRDDGGQDGFSDGESDLAALLAPMPGDRGADAGPDEDFIPLLTSSGGTAAKLVTDQVAPGRGSTPPTGLATWPEDDALMLRGGLEACVSVAERVVGPRFSSQQARALGVLWRELVERMEAAGIADDDQ